jgi:hypothetical protein
MKKSFLFLVSAFVLALAVSCGEDDSKQSIAVSVSFANQSANLTEGGMPVQILFSEAAPSAGQITVELSATNVTYGTDFTTNPVASGNTVVVPFQAGATSASFTIANLVALSEEQIGSVKFTIANVSINANITGITSTLINFYEAPSSGNSYDAVTGGPTQPNQVYVDLSSGGLITVPRVSWDLGFYSGSDHFRLVLNGSLKMTAKPLTTTNIDEVQQEDSSMLFGQGSGSADYVDDPTGDITKTVIQEVADNDDDNPVYLVNLGNGPSDNAPAVGTEGSAGGPQRGWKKVRILKSGNDYVFQYADLNATTHEEVVISKNAAYNFTFFSFTSNTVVQAEPQKNLWDLNFTTFTNFIPTGSSNIPYYYADFIVTNIKGGARSYQVLTDEFTYAAFAKANVVEVNFNEDQRNIGSNWRSTSVNGPDGVPVSQFVLKTDRFYVVKDPAGNYYKLRMTQGANQAGERGFPKFEYELLK